MGLKVSEVNCLREVICTFYIEYSRWTVGSHGVVTSVINYSSEQIYTPEPSIQQPAGRETCVFFALFGPLAKAEKGGFRDF